MVRGNWQRRVELNDARRAAAKAQKEQRRTRQQQQRSSSGAAPSDADHGAAYARLDDWLVREGDRIGVGDWRPGGGPGDGDAAGEVCDAAEHNLTARVDADVWTDRPPAGREEYLPPPPDRGGPGDDGGAAWSDDDDDPRRKKKGGGRRPSGRKAKGRSHPNANHREQEHRAASGKPKARDRSDSGAASLKRNLCPDEFYGGMEPRRQHQKGKKGGKAGRRDRSSSAADEADAPADAPVQYYADLPRARRGGGDGRPAIRPMTLHQSLGGRYPLHLSSEGGRPSPSLPARAREASLAACRDAADGTGMLYHSRVTIENRPADGTARDDDDDGEDGGGSDGDGSSDGEKDAAGGDSPPASGGVLAARLRDLLSDSSVPPSSVVYVAVQGVVVYDRNRNGVVMSPAEERFLLDGEPLDVADYSRARSSSDAGPGEGEEGVAGKPSGAHELLPPSVLEDVLSYLPDESAGALPRVCRAWRDEVGTRSPRLWTDLLDRRGWPLDECGENAEDEGGDEEGERIRRRRAAFVKHYSAARDVRGLVRAVDALAGGTVPAGGSGECGVLAFKSAKGSPVLDRVGYGRRESAVRVWPGAGPGARAAAAYGDGTLRLYDALPAGGPGGTVRVRQTSCVRTTPPEATQKRGGCALLAMGLDGENAAVLVAERMDWSDDRFGRENERRVPWLTVLPCEEVACAGNEGLVDEGRVGSFNLREAVLDFLLGDPPRVGADGTPDPLREALLSTPDGRDVADVTVAPSLVPCGRGHYLFHARVFVFGYAPLGPGGMPAAPGTGDHRLFVLSSRTGSIAASHRLDDDRPGTSVFASDPEGVRGGSTRTRLVVARPAAPVVALPAAPTLLLSVVVRGDGAVEFAETATIAPRDLTPRPTMRAALSGDRAVFATDHVPGTTLHFHEAGGRGDGTRAALHSVSVGGQDSRVHGLFMVGDEHAAIVVGGRPDDDAVAGEWFGLGGTPSEVVLYHLGSRSEIYRSPIASGDATADHAGDCLAASVSDLGFVLAGARVREVARSGGERLPPSPGGRPSAKAKKKRLTSLASGRKKDGFARGMSLRG